MIDVETLHKHISLYLAEKYPDWQWEDVDEASGDEEGFWEEE